jgi:hypothetical protein
MMAHVVPLLHPRKPCHTQNEDLFQYAWFYDGALDLWSYKCADIVTKF